jgi:two-component system, NtrC family, sensor kinase
MPEPRARILLVDDSAAYRRVIQTMLGPKYDFLQAETGEQALAEVEAFGPDLIVSDLIMPGLDGYELCRRIRVIPSLVHVPIILLTSKTGDESRVTGLEVGADDYLFKPIRPRELNARVGSLLRLRRATLDLEEKTRLLEYANENLKKAQAELIRQEKLASLGQLVAGIAHELNNPLNYIYGNTEFLFDYVKTFIGLVDRVDTLPGLTAEQRTVLEAWKQEADLEFVKTDLQKLLDGVRLGAERAADIVRGLRAFARVGSGVEFDEVSLTDTMEIAITVLRHELRDRIRIHRDFQPVPRVRCDGTRISQVFVNLILNATQAIQGEGDIFLSMRTEGGQLKCQIRDTGSGIPPDVKTKIFDPFFTTKPVGQGTGLGLSISYGIVEQHGGRIEVESEAGKGSTFTIWLPLRGPSSRPLEKTAATG